MEKINAVITGVGGYVPDYILTNDEISKMVDTTDEWIMGRIGIKERRILKEEGLGTSYIARKAVKQLIKRTPVGTHQPHDRSYQQRQDRRIEQYKKVFIFFPIRFVDDGSARGYFIRVNMKIIQLFIVIDESLRDFCHSYFLGRCTF